MSLLLSLKEYRQVRSLKDQIPLYCVFGDTVIKSIAEKRPASHADLQTIRGFTEDKCLRYGEDILQLVKKAAAPAAKKPPAPPVVLRHARNGAAMHPWAQRRAVLKAGIVAATASKKFAGPSSCKEGVYILELSQGRVYVGYSKDIKRRIEQHMTGQGSAFTKAFPPTGVLLPRLGRVSGSPEAAERDETLRYMFLRGIPVVRGWRYVRVEMPDAEMQDAEENIRELFDLCRRCGHPGHFITNCKANFDRLGKPCKSV